MALTAEEEVGITQFSTEGRGFEGILKHRWLPAPARASWWNGMRAVSALPLRVGQGRGCGLQALCAGGCRPMRAEHEALTSTQVPGLPGDGGGHAGG